MLANGNGAPQACALNILRTARGEVPYARTKGVDRALIDAPATEAWRLEADATWALAAYEPRVDARDAAVRAEAAGAAAGDFTLAVDVEGRG